MEALKAETRTMVFYESPHRLRASLSDLFGTLGDRRCALARELTKLHEEVQRGTLSQLVACYGEREPRGEYAVVVEGEAADTLRQAEQADWSRMPVAAHVALYESSGMDRMAAMKQAAKDRGLSKRDVYQALQEQAEKT